MSIKENGCVRYRNVQSIKSFYIFFCRLLHKAEDVRLLDLRGCTNFNLGTLETATATNVEHLYLSQSAVSRDSSRLVAVVSKVSMLKLFFFFFLAFFCCHIAAHPGIIQL
jgi:hypothetical protein